MSAHITDKRLTIRDIRARKNGVPIVCLTAYSAPIARMLDPIVDLFIVGDSVGMVLYGMDTTLGVSVEMMIAHGQAVMRGSSRACIVVDMPFGSYQESPEQAFRNAADHARNRLFGGQAGRRGGNGLDHCFPRRTRRAGDGSYRAEAANGACGGRIPRSG